MKYGITISVLIVTCLFLCGVIIRMQSRAPGTLQGRCKDDGTCIGALFCVHTADPRVGGYSSEYTCLPKPETGF